MILFGLFLIIQEETMIVWTSIDLGLENQWFFMTLRATQNLFSKLWSLNIKRNNKMRYFWNQNKVDITKLTFIKVYFEGFLFGEEPIESWKFIDFPNQAHLKFGLSWFPLECWETVQIKSTANFQMSIYKRNFSSD